MDLQTLLTLEKEKQGVIIKLDLSDRALTSIPLEVFELTELEELVVRNNQLTELPLKLFQLKKLTKLDFRKNNIAVLPTEIQHLTKLHFLNLGENQLKELPIELFSLELLHSLLLAHNQIQHLPFIINQLHNLRILNLRNNKLEEIPLSIKELQKLEYLHIENNKLVLVPSVIWDLPKLCNFTWKKQQGIIPPQKGNYYEEIESLSLSKKELTEIPKLVFKFKNLKRLILSNNNIQDIPFEIREFEHLEEVDLYNNQISKLSAPLFMLSKLKHLNLGKNLLTKYPYVALGLDHLITFSTAENPLKKGSNYDQKILTTIQAIQSFNFELETRINIFAILIDSLKHYSKIPKSDFFRALRINNWAIFYNASHYLIHVLGEYHHPKNDSEIVFLGDHFLLDQDDYIQRLKNIGIRYSTEFTATTTHVVLTFPSKEETLPSKKDIIFLDERLLNHFLNQKEPKYFQTQDSETEKEHVIKLLNHAEHDNYEIGVELLFSLGVSHDLLYHIIISLFIRNNTEAQKTRLKQLLYLYGSEDLYRTICIVPHTHLTKWNFSKYLELMCKNTELDINVFYRFVDKNKI